MLYFAGRFGMLCFGIGIVSFYRATELFCYCVGLAMFHFVCIPVGNVMLSQSVASEPGLPDAFSIDQKVPEIIFFTDERFKKLKYCPPMGHAPLQLFARPIGVFRFLS
jgi:hypothetical protein